LKSDRVKLLLFIDIVFRYSHLTLQLRLSNRLYFLIYSKLLELLRRSILIRVDAMRAWLSFLLDLLIQSCFMQLQKWESSWQLRFLFSTLLNEHAWWFQPVCQPLRLRCLHDRYALFNNRGAPFPQHHIVYNGILLLKCPKVLIHLVYHDRRLIRRVLGGLRVIQRRGVHPLQFVHWFY
jgi:hypothetical protein